MHDIKAIKADPKRFSQKLKMRGAQDVTQQILELDEARVGALLQIQQLQHARNERSKLLGQPQDAGQAERIKEEVRQINSQLKAFDIDAIEEELRALLDTVPNVLGDDVPYGADENANVEVLRYKEPVQLPNAKEHFVLGVALGMMDFEQTAKISGSRFVTLSGQLARLERAIANFMLDVHTQEFGFLEVAPPLVVRDHAMYCAGQLPKFADESFRTDGERRLIPTSEVSLVNLVQDRIIPMEDLPMRLVSHTPCFRLEAGSAGKDVKGIMRLHQFNKVELVSVALPDESEEEHQFILKAAQIILQRLELPYRVMLLCSRDTGFHSQKTYDIEVWLPGQGRYREISSCSNCGSFQARRLKARYKGFGDKGTTFVHTLNGSGLATGRTLLAVMENYQQPDGSIRVPDALQTYMGGMEVIHGGATRG